MTPDCELLCRYAEARSEEAFAELVRRHVGIVYSAALRQLNGDSSLAQDVAQNVFSDLARKAASLSSRKDLAGWLYTSAHFAATKVVRRESRRRAHEQEAQTMHDLLQTRTDEPDWEKLQPVLDQAMHELNEADREAILLRYFQNSQHAVIAERLGINENAARMRVERAVEKLRDHLSRRGISTSATALSVVLTAHGSQAAPIGLAATISTAATLAGTTLATAATATTIKTIAMTALQKTVVTATVAVLAGVGIFEARHASQLRKQVQSLQQQQMSLAGIIQKHEQEREDGARQLAALRNENERLNRNTAELLKLRGDAARSQSDPHKLGQSNGNIRTEGAEVALTSWLNRVEEFKRLPERMPDKTIPELRLLTEEDWLELAKRPLDHEAGEVNLDDDVVARLVFSAVRAKAKDKLMRVFSRALEGYANANGDQLPTDTLQLKPHLMNSHFQGPARVVHIPESAVDDTVLRRYEILQTGKLTDVPGDATILAEKAPVDSEYDTRLRVGRFWMSVHGSGIEAYSSEDGTKTE
jgi:RNA polymerase sigma factor (sigma-70 family)